MKRSQELQETQRQMEEADKKFADQASFLLQKKKLDRIDSFSEFFDFLNNDYPCYIHFSSFEFRSISHAFQAARTNDPELQKRMALAETPMEVYEIALQLDDPEDWQQRRLIIMEQLVRDKFRRHKDLRERLKATGSRELCNSYEEATPSNMYWGMVDGKGQNQLGRMLEQIRYDVSNGLELKKWIMSNFGCQESRDLIPKITLEVSKNGNLLEKHELKHKSFYLFGRSSQNDVVLQHPSISTFHAAIIITEDQGPVLVDFESRGKSYLDMTELEPHVALQLKPKCTINFAFSTRKYAVHIDYSYVQRHIQNLQKSLQSDMKTLQKLNNNPDAQTILESLHIIQKYGNIKDIRLPIDRATGQLKGLAFLEFEHASSVEKALVKDGFQLRDRRLRVSIAEDRGRSRDRNERQERKRSRSRDRGDRKRSQDRKKDRSKSRDRKKSHDRKRR